MLSQTIDSSEQSMIKNFIKLIDGDKADVPPVSFESAKDAQKILESIYTSNGNWVNFD